MGSLGGFGGTFSGLRGKQIWGELGENQARVALFPSTPRCQHHAAQDPGGGHWCVGPWGRGLAPAFWQVKCHPHRGGNLPPFSPNLSGLKGNSGPTFAAAGAGLDSGLGPGLRGPFKGGPRCLPLRRWSLRHLGSVSSGKINMHCILLKGRLPTACLYFVWS